MRAAPFVLDDLPWLTRRLVEWALDVRAFRRLRADAMRLASDPFDRAVLRALDVGVEVSPTDLARIPPTGPVIVVANHPHGAVDGLVLIDIVRRVRPDVRLLANRMLARVPELRDVCFFVDPFDGPAAASRSVAGLRAAHRWLQNGGAVIAFPAGEVAHRVAGANAVDGRWHDTVFRIAERTGAQIVHAHIGGANSRLFYIAGRVHRSLRTVLLGRELLKQRGRRVRVSITARADAVAREVAALPAATRLVTSGSFDVYCTSATRIPAALCEIGRLRERAFRAVGEGTGRAIDLDRFDAHYLHLFVWNRDTREIVGAYRMGQTDTIVARDGVGGLYTRALFRYDARLLRQVGGPVLELGRSFVREEYQKNYSALLLLWRGIGEFLVRHPRYRHLLGPVSISARHSNRSRETLMAFLERKHFDPALARLVAPTNPPVRDAGTPHSIEPDRSNIPVLLRHYLKLNARAIGFNVDAAFGDALDALMIVDLARVESAVLARYLGRDSLVRAA